MAGRLERRKHPLLRFGLGACVRPRRRVSTASLVYLTVSSLLGMCGGAYTAQHSCESDLATITTPQGRLYTSASTQNTNPVGGGTIETMTTTVVRRHNTTEIDLALKYFMADLKSLDNTGQHTQLTAARHCGVTSTASWPWSLGTLKNTVMRTIETSCNYVVGINGTHLYGALFRMDTECSRNAADQFCLLPAHFLKAADPWSLTESAVVTNGPLTVTTEVVTSYSYEFTYGGGDLVHGICPNINKTDTDRAVPAADCCNRVLYDAQYKYLNLGPKLFCSEPQGIGNTCTSVSPASVEISDAQGGTLSMTSGMSVTFPPGALAGSGCVEPCPIIAKAVLASAQTAAIKKATADNKEWQDVTLATSFYDLEPSLNFSKAVTVCMKAVNGSANNESEVYQFDKVTHAIISAAKGGLTYKPSEDLLCFETLSFSRYGGLSRTKPAAEGAFTNVSGSKSSNAALIVGCVLGGVLLLTALAGCFMISQRNRKKGIEAYERKIRAASRDSRSPNSSYVTSRVTSPNPLMPMGMVPSGGIPPGAMAMDGVAGAMAMNGVGGMYMSNMGGMPMSGSAGPMFASNYNNSGNGNGSNNGSNNLFGNVDPMFASTAGSQGPMNY